MAIGVVKVHPFYAVINTCLKNLNIIEPLAMLFTKPPGVFCASRNALRRPFSRSQLKGFSGIVVNSTVNAIHPMFPSVTK